MSGRHEVTSTTRQSETVVQRTDRSSEYLSVTSGEAATILSVPLLLLAVHFLIQPFVDAWTRFGYVRYEVARAAPAGRIAPEPFIDHAWWWHELTRLSHALVHDPSGYHTHVVGNAVLIGVAAWALLTLLSALGQRRWFVFVYWEVAVVAPVVGSFSFDLFGETPHGYGASTVGYAFLGIVLMTGFVVLARHVRTWVDDQGSTRPLRADGGEVLSPVVVVCLLVVVGAIVLVDLFSGSPATPVHQAGVGFGALVGTAVPIVARW
ncbi:hypothetical protein [Salinigranum sp. GCM10025319]|uniref:hypothetical protein n=1 Tax=Salinigranum sp. GCM10025319 TaxID=3252687 RepID=UPI00361040A9